MKQRTWMMTTAAVLLALLTATAQAVTIETMPVGNVNNTGQLSGAGAGGYGPDRICGAVGYAYNIGKYEVTAGQYKDFLNAVGGEDTYGLYNASMSSITFGSGITRIGGGTVGNPYTYSVATDFIKRPVNYVSYGDAMRFANWLHNGQQGPGTTETGAYTLNGAISNADLLAVSRNTAWKWAVTSEDEWYKAAYHDKNAGTAATYFTYPTSSNTAPGQNMTDTSGNNANYYTSPYAYPIDSGKYTTLGGEFENSASPYGTFDQGGNVWEWNEAIIASSSRGLRGGAFVYGLEYNLRASDRNHNGPTNEDGKFGFRVANVPEPGSFAMLAGIAVTALLYYWRKHV